MSTWPIARDVISAWQGMAVRGSPASSVWRMSRSAMLQTPARGFVWSVHGYLLRQEQCW